MSNKKKNKSPSRIKYEKNNPTVSGRLPLIVRNNLRASLKARGMTISEALKVLAGEIEVKDKSLEEAEKSGYEEAKKIFSVTYSCSVCGKPTYITSPKTKEVVAKHLSAKGLGHAQCLKHENQK